MKTESVQKTIILADGLKVTLDLDGEGKVQQVATRDMEPQPAMIIYRLSELLRKEDGVYHYVCADHGTYKPEKTGMCPECHQPVALTEAA